MDEKIRDGSAEANGSLVLATIGLGINPVRWQAQSSKLLNVLWIVGRFDFDWFPPVRSKSVISDVLGYTE
jgi:hypothetical protein